MKGKILFSVLVACVVMYVSADYSDANMSTAYLGDQSKAKVPNYTLPASLPLKPARKVTKTLNNWLDSYEHDDMRGTEQKFSMNRSLNDVVFDFPYNHGSYVDVSVRSRKVKLKPGQKKEDLKPDTAYLVLTDGQFDCGFYGCNAYVKFDDGKVEKFTMDRSTGGRNDVLFFNDPIRFIREMQQHKRMTLEVTFFQEGSHQFTYNLERGSKTTYDTN